MFIEVHAYLYESTKNQIERRIICCIRPKPASLLLIFFCLVFRWIKKKWTQKSILFKLSFLICSLKQKEDEISFFNYKVIKQPFVFSFFIIHIYISSSSMTISIELSFVFSFSSHFIINANGQSYINIQQFLS